MAASIATRCLRATRAPCSLFQLAQAAPIARPSTRFPLSAFRTFSTTPLREIRKYTKDHEWVDLSADKTSGVIGISEYAAEELGDVVYVELPEEGKAVQAGDAIGAVESVKSAADINAPIACRVTSINMLLEEKPGTINQVPEDDSHGGGWIAKVAVDEAGVKDFENLMDAEEYKAFTGSEE
ncbi:Glycine cleavage system H protein 2 [Apiospora rasikravindrae]|uniref:Glycine cleavage system H protein n=1 Tax=Apiospora rasikravindrae TaxID=990691 RepID=A0ABR1RTJ9_9PEZI